MMMIMMAACTSRRSRNMFAAAATHLHPHLVLLLLFFSGHLTSTITTVNAHNITRILSNHPSLSSFNHYLSLTHLADEINRRRTITVCTFDNSAMDSLLSHHFSLPTLKNILSLHVFADYFGSKKLHSIPKHSTTTASLYQATGEASGTSGYVDILLSKAGQVSFSAVDSDPHAPKPTFLKSIAEMPYNISVIQISHALSSPEAEAPTASPADIDVVSLMARQGCKGLSDLIVAQGIQDNFTRTLEGGLTIFCPSEDALKSFMPKYRGLSSRGKSLLLLYHGTPEYNSMGTLRSSNGLMNTLAATDDSFTLQNQGDTVKIETEVVTALVKETLIDEDPFAVYGIDKVLQPPKLFKAGAVSAKARGANNADAPGPGGDNEDPADANKAGGYVGKGGRITALLLSLSLSLSWLIGLFINLI